MKVFDVFDSGKQPVKAKATEPGTAPRPTSTATKNQISRDKRESTKLSPSEAEAKIRSHFAKDKDVAEISPKAFVKKEKIVVGDNLPNPKSEVDETPAKLGDFSNDPGDPVIREKLKGALKAGAISFSEKERAALADILK